MGGADVLQSGHQRGEDGAMPASLIVTPPDERDPLKVTWKGGEVPVSGNASSVSLTVVRAGNGA